MLHVILRLPSAPSLYRLQVGTKANTAKEFYGDLDGNCSGAKKVPQLM